MPPLSPPLSTGVLSTGILVNRRLVHGRLVNRRLVHRRLVVEVLDSASCPPGSCRAASWPRPWRRGHLGQGQRDREIGLRDVERLADPIVAVALRQPDVSSCGESSVSDCGASPSASRAPSCSRNSLAPAGVVVTSALMGSASSTRLRTPWPRPARPRRSRCAARTAPSRTARWCACRGDALDARGMLHRCLPPSCFQLEPAGLTQRSKSCSGRPAADVLTVAGAGRCRASSGPGLLSAVLSPLFRCADRRLSVFRFVSVITRYGGERGADVAGRSRRRCRACRPCGAHALAGRQSDPPTTGPDRTSRAAARPGIAAELLRRAAAPAAAVAASARRRVACASVVSTGMPDGRATRSNSDVRRGGWCDDLSDPSGTSAAHRCRSPPSSSPTRWAPRRAGAGRRSSAVRALRQSADERRSPGSGAAAASARRYRGRCGLPWPSPLTWSGFLVRPGTLSSARPRAFRQSASRAPRRPTTSRPGASLPAAASGLGRRADRGRRLRPTRLRQSPPASPCQHGRRVGGGVASCRHPGRAAEAAPCWACASCAASIQRGGRRRRRRPSAGLEWWGSC